MTGNLFPEWEVDAVRLAICNELFEGWPLERVCEVVRGIGYTGLELAPFTLAKRITDLDEPAFATLRNTIEKHGLEVVGLHWLLAHTEEFHLTSPDGEVRCRTAGYLIALAEACAQLGGNVLVFGSPKQRNLLPGVSRNEALGYAEEVFRSLLPALERTGVKLCVEPLAPAETDFLNSIAEAEELIARLAHPHVVLHLDVKAMSADPGGSIPDLIRRYGRQAGHLHVQDPNRQGPGMGPGCIDFAPILSAIRDSGYPGWVSVEVFDYTPGAEETARQSFATLTRG